MTDVKEQVKNYIKQKRRATIPEIQVESGFSFKAVYEAILKLSEEGKVCLTDGLYYEMQPEKTILQSMSEQQRRWQEIREGLFNEGDDDEDGGEEGDDDEGCDSFEETYEEDIRRRRQALEQRRRELIERMRRFNEQTPRQEEENENCDDFAKDTQDGKMQEENTEETAEPQNVVEQNDVAAMETVSENTGGVPALINALTAVNPAQRLVDTLNVVNPAQRLVNGLNDINPITRLANVISGIAAKKEYEQSELFAARRHLSIALHNIAAAQDDKLRNGGKSYSEEYFSAFNATISICKVAESKYELKADNVFFTNQQPYKIYLIYVGNRSYLSDEGQVYDLLSRRIGNSRAKRKLEKHTELKLWLKFEKGTLLMPTSIKHSVGDYFSMYYAMRSLLETF